MSVHARDEELLVEWNDIARLSLPASYSFSYQIDKNNTTHGTGLRKIKMFMVSCPKVNRPEVSRLRLFSAYSNQDCGTTSTLIIFNFPF